MHLVNTTPTTAGNGKPARRRRPVRVCFLIDELNVAGTEMQLLRLIGSLNRKAVMPFLCVLRGESAQSRMLEPANCPVLRLGVGSLHRPGAFFKTLQLARYLQLNKIDVLQVYFPDSTYLGTTAAHLAGVHHVIRVRNNLNHWMTPTHRLLGRLVNRLISRTTANCEACRQAVLADDHLPPRSVVVLENGVDLSPFLAIPPVSWREHKPRRVGTVANLRSVKGLDVFIDAAARLAPDHGSLEFAIAGEGEERLHLQEQVYAEGLTERVRLLGSIRNIPAFLAGLDIAVLSSRSEGMPNALLEYMAAGRPIVATAVGAVPEMITDGIHGLLVRPDDAEALSNAVQRLLADPQRANRLGAAARRRAAERFSRAAMVSRFEAFYECLIFGARSGAR